ncbi:kelch domain-containing protein 2-like [Dendronephthya gigantea]|uniref:kelch domain-containing protein 2-like n=1 Tax=Dendronephthya gigantea TaxID=151771 RepID=UPI0010694E54|nr:kelch domain-containing protein 2-like [Dendronephthya gigantea]
MSLYIPDIESEKPDARCGHICFEFRGNVYVWGGYTDDDGCRYLPSRSLWIYHVNSSSWKHVHCTGEIPVNLSGACASRVGQTLFIFGGHCLDFGHSEKLYSLDLVTYKWKNQSDSVLGNAPLPRDKFGSWVIDDRIIYFGGYGRSPDKAYYGPFTYHEHMRGWNGQVAVLHLQADDVLEWKYPKVKGDPPQPRAAHGMTRIGKKGYLFGGRHSVCRDNDLYCLDLDNLTWSGRLQVSGPQPCGRSWHVFVTCGPEHILLHGGFDAFNRELEDAWLLDVNRLEWIEIDAFTKIRPPKTRLWHAACRTENEGEIAIFGGSAGQFFGPNTRHTNELFFFNFTPRSLQRLCEEVVKTRGNDAFQLGKLPRHIGRNLKPRSRSHER